LVFVLWQRAEKIPGERSILSLSGDVSGKNETESRATGFERRFYLAAKHDLSLTQFDGGSARDQIRTQDGKWMGGSSDLANLSSYS